MRPQSYATVAFVVLWSIWALPVSAQDTFQPGWANFGSANLGMNTLAHQQDLFERRGRVSGGDSALDRRRQFPVITTYRNDPEISKRVVLAFSDYVNRIAGPEKAAMVRGQLLHKDFVSIWLRITGADGYKAGDAVDALAAYCALNWAIANEGDPSPKQAAGVRRQIRIAISSSPNFVKFSQAQRQAMAEAYMINFIYQQGEYFEAMKRNDRGRLRALADAAVTRFRTEMGIDLRRIALTDQGFRPRG